MDERNEELRIPVIQEELDITKSVIETGRLKVSTRTSERHEAVEMPLSREEFTVERVAINRPVDAPVEVRQQGDVTIVPVREEELVVVRRLMLKEELHIRRRVHETVETRDVVLRRQDVDVVRESAPRAPGTH